MSYPTWLTFAEPPTPGLSIIIGGQNYRLLEHEPYRRKDGTMTVLLIWNAECAACGEAFLCNSAADRLPQNRRCQNCKRPGVKVDPERRECIAATAGTI